MLKASVALFEEINLGDEAHFEQLIDREMVASFAAISGDYNPLHMDDVYASETPFEGRIAHGMIAGALFSRLVGMHLPGLYALYLSQSLNFKKPMSIGLKTAVRGEVIAKNEAFKTITLKTELKDSESGELLVSGEALVKLLK